MLRIRRVVVGLASVALVSVVAAGCSSAPGDEESSGANELSADKAKKDAGVDSGKDAGKDSGADAGKDSGSSPDSGGGGGGSGDGDGTPVRNTCSSTFGSALKGSFGRLDGTIVSIVDPGGSSKCNGDSTHLHLQVLMNDAIYDVAINVDGGYWYQADVPLPGAPWAEGYYEDSLDYTTDLGVKSTQFTAISQSALSTALEQQLATVNHITTYGTIYTGSDAGSGMHDIHFESKNKDGAIFLQPLSADAHMILFRFSGDSF
jgi:hypothetical protein